MGEDEPTEAMHLGLTVGGTRDVDKRWVEAAKELRRDISERRHGVISDINVALELAIPGNVWSPDFEGVRTGAFRRRDKLLRVQIAVPSTAPEDPRAELLRLFTLGLDAVDAWAARRRRAVDTGPLRQLLEDLP